MPKNRLKSRLSPEQAGSLIYPPDPPISSLSFNFPFGASEKADGRAVNGHGNRHYADQVAHCTCGGDHGEESEEEEIVYDHPNFRVQSPVEGVQQRRMAEGGRVGKPAPPASIASSADGYESFENTSNKKKRKIPLSGSSGVHQSSLTAELANMGISNGTDGASDDVPQHGQNSYPASTGMGHAGAGRGRTSKPSPMRRRERVSISHHTNGNGYAASVEQSVERGGAYKGDGTRISMTLPTAAPPAPVAPSSLASNPLPDQQPPQEHKIISNAIANAQSQPSTPIKGKENVSLLHQASQPSPKSATPKTQFTFTCESDSSNKMVWPGPGAAPYASPTPNSHQQYAAAARAGAQTNQGTQTYPTLRHVRNQQINPPTQSHTQQAQNPTNTGATATAPPKKPRPRRPSKEYARAARERREQQRYTNLHHKPTKENMWICEFCEYEDIWGEPPSALIRQYEIKDRAEQKKADEKRRLLEKAKMKGRKGKKGTKNGKNNSANSQTQHQQQQQQQPGAQAYDDHGHAVQNQSPPQDGQEEYYDEGYDDRYDPVEPDPADSGRGRDEPPQATPGAEYQYDNRPPAPPDKPGVNSASVSA